PLPSALHHASSESARSIPPAPQPQHLSQVAPHTISQAHIPFRRPDSRPLLVHSPLPHRPRAPRENTTTHWRSPSRSVATPPLACPQPSPEFPSPPSPAYRSALAHWCAPRSNSAP